MKIYFVDTNIILRFLLNDNKLQYPTAKLIFESAEKGKIKLWITDVVILETVWTLGSLYKFKKTEIKEKIEAIIALKNIDVLNKDVILNALYTFEEKNVDFADAYNFYLATRKNVGILSFDKDFQKLGAANDIKKFTTV